MSSDFVFIDPSKIPPRRSVKPSRSGHLKIRKINSKIWENDFYVDSDSEIENNPEVPEFSLLAGVLPDANLAWQSESDPLSQAIFSPEKENFVSSSNIVLAKTTKEDKPKINIRQALLAELANIENKDQEA